MHYLGARAGVHKFLVGEGRCQVLVGAFERSDKELMTLPRP